MPTCPPCDDNPATRTNALTSIHVFNDFIRNGSDIKELHVKVKRSALVCQNGPKRARGRILLLMTTVFFDILSLTMSGFD